MLKEIYCEQFKEDGKIRPKIKFHEGLNTIVGTGSSGEKSENSVGKSTLLMIIDFTFGGNEFLKSKTTKIIGSHTICFAFEFDEKPYHFMRLADKENSLFKCDENYQNSQKYEIDEFRKWLKIQYKLSNIDLSFREIVGTYFRFYGGEKEISPKEILRTYSGQSGTEQVRALEKLFEKYSAIKDYVDVIQNSENHSKIKAQASKLKVEIAEFKEINIEETEQKISELEAQKQELLKNQKANIPEFDAQNAKQIAELKSKHKTLAAKRARLLIRIENIENANFETVKPSRASYDSLLEFFPNADIKKIEEIDTFHEKLSNILSEEHKEALEEYKTELDKIQAEIENIEKQISDFGNSEDFTTAFLLEFSKIQGEIDKFNELLEKDKAKKSAAIQLKEDRKNLKPAERIILDEIQNDINKELESLSDTVLGKNIQSLEFYFPTNASYCLGSPLDDGTGTDYTSLILFDLAVLSLTKLPALIHDSYLLSNIRGKRLENLIKTYAKQIEKQIFLSIDETEKLNSDSADLINDENTCVIKLHHGGGELYGYYWGEKQNL